MNNVGSKTLFNPVFISIASTLAFVAVYIPQGWQENTNLKLYTKT
jgi:hypothetical protein